jgi:ABC-type dipeptide/oligopeptide/nickel transport system ATPase component
MLGKAREDKISRKEFKMVLTEVAKELQQRPPVIGLVGVSGVGKSSTINKIFKTNLETSDTVASSMLEIARPIVGSVSCQEEPLLWERSRRCSIGIVSNPRERCKLEGGCYWNVYP